jgi:hypothetical protein
MNKPSKSNILKQIFLLVIVLSVICGLVYWAVQQDLRMSANDPQIQLAEDTATQLNSGGKLPVTAKINITQSLAPFLIIYDKQGNPILSQASLNGQTPLLPTGVLADTQKLGEDRLTWQPAHNVRIAAIITPYKNGYVLAGRNLREIEKREDQLTNEVGLSWGIGIIAIVFTIICLQIL